MLSKKFWPFTFFFPLSLAGTDFSKHHISWTKSPYLVIGMWFVRPLLKPPKPSPFTPLLNMDVVSFSFVALWCFACFLPFGSLERADGFRDRTALIFGQNYPLPPSPKTRLFQDQPPDTFGIQRPPPPLVILSLDFWELVEGEKFVLGKFQCTNFIIGNFQQILPTVLFAALNLYCQKQRHLLSNFQMFH